MILCTVDFVCECGSGVDQKQKKDHFHCFTTRLSSSEGYLKNKLYDKLYEYIGHLYFFNQIDSFYFSK